MRIGFISQWYDPETGSAAIPGSVVRALEARGHSVEVVTGYPNYPSGTIYPGYRMRLMWREQLGRTTVNRVPIYPSHDSSGTKRALTYLAFMVTASTLGAFRLRKADVILVYSTSATVGIAGVVSRLAFRRRYVLYIEDLWPDSVLASGMVPRSVARPGARMLHWLSGLGYRHAARIAVISPGMMHILISRGVDPDKIDVVYNWVDEDVFKPIPRSARSSDGFDLMYAGNLGDVQGLDVAVRALAELKDRPDIRLRFVGSGVAQPSLQKLASELGVADRVMFEGLHPLEGMAELMATADAQVVCLKDLPLFHATMPSKTQAILACGQPVVVSAPGDVAALVEQSGAGLTAEPGDAVALAAAFRTMADLSAEARASLGSRGRDFYEAELCASVGAARLEATMTKSAGMWPA